MTIPFGKYWGYSAEKANSRLDMFQAYREASGLQSIPKFQQYWTMCGQMSTMDGKLQENCELIHVVNQGIASQAQFVGVEKNPKTHAYNQIACANLRGPRLIGGDIVTALHAALDEDPNFNPGFINLDTTFEPDRAQRLCEGVFEVLAHTKNFCFVAWNVVTRNRRRKSQHDPSDGADYFRASVKYPQWKCMKEAYGYDGTWPTYCHMTTFYFYKESTCERSNHRSTMGHGKEGKAA